MSTLPTYEQIVRLPAVFDQLVPEEFIDYNGHMNIGDYFRLCSHAMWKTSISDGVGDHRRRPRLGSTFVRRNGHPPTGHIRILSGDPDYGYAP